MARMAGNVLAWIVGGILIIAGLTQVFQIPLMVDQFENWGLSGWIVVIGILQLVIGILFILSETASYGILLASAFFGGAIATHLGHNQAVLALVPSLLLVGSWVSYYMRHPAFFRR